MAAPPSAADGVDVRGYFTAAEGHGRDLLLRVAALLRWLATEPRRRPWEDVFRDMTAGDGRPFEPRLLGELAQHGRDFGSRPAEQRKALLGILPRVVRAAGWRDIRRYGPEVVAPLAGRGVDLGPVYRETALRCPEEPSDRDLEFLLDLAARSGVDLRKARPIVEAVRTFAPPHRLDPEARACLRRLLIDRLPTLPPEEWGPISAVLQRCLGCADGDQLAGVVAALRALCGRSAMPLPAGGWCGPSWSPRSSRSSRPAYPPRARASGRPTTGRCRPSGSWRRSGTWSPN